MNEWRSYTPDGHELTVRRVGNDAWFVRCGSGEARSESLDVALIDALRADHTTALHKLERDYSAWVQKQADAIRAELERDERSP
jgi:hypothetical protein